MVHRGVLTRAYRGENWRRPQAGHGQRRQVRPQAQDVGVPAAEAVRRRADGETLAAIAKT